MSEQQLDNLSIAWLRRKHGKKWSGVDDDVLAAWVADMDFPLPAVVASAVRREIDRGDLGYPAPEDNLEVDFRNYMQRRHGWDPAPDRTLEITDVLNGLHAILHVTTQPGDAVAVHVPTYPPFLETFEHLGLDVAPIPLHRTATGWAFEPTEAAEAIRRSRLFLVVNPHNPTGKVFAKEELRVLGSAAVESGALIVADELHADLVYPGRTHIPLARLSPEIAGRTVTLTSATKSFNMAGIRCAVAHIGDDVLWQRLEELPDHLFGLVSNLARVATRAAWRDGDAWLAGLLPYLDGNRRRVTEQLVGHLPAVGYVAPEATYLAWLDLRSFDIGDDPSKLLLEKAGVRLSPGPRFGDAGRGHVRLNFATSAPILDAILIRITTALRSL